MSDGYDLHSNGTITIEFEDDTRELRRPSLGAYRLLIEKLGDMRDRVEAAKEREEELTIDEQFDVLLSWVDLVLEKLSGRGLPRKTVEGVEVIDDDRVPAWLLQAKLVSDFITHWQTIPSRHGGQ